MPETVYACVDVEASGPIPDPFNLVSIGAIAVRRQDRPGESASWAVDETSLFYAELRPVYPGFDSEAMAIHGISREHLEKLGIDPAAAMRRLADWALGLGGQPVFVGHNAVFDWAYVNHYFVRTGVANPFGWKALDTKSLAAGVLRLPFLETSKEILAQWLPDLNPEDRERKHRADYDALYQAHLLVELLNHKPA